MNGRKGPLNQELDGEVLRPVTIYLTDSERVALAMIAERISNEENEGEDISIAELFRLVGRGRAALNINRGANASSEGGANFGRQ